MHRYASKRQNCPATIQKNSFQGEKQGYMAQKEATPLYRRILNDNSVQAKKHQNCL